MNIRRFFSATLLFFIGTFFVFFSSVPANAQIIIDPPPGGWPEPLPAPIDQVQIELQEVDIVVDGPLAQVHLTQLLRNDSVRPIEGVYLFPLPENAAIGDFQMTVNGEVIEGEILRKDDARRLYEEIVRQRRDPALLEYVGRDLFQVSVFPIPAGESRKLELSYSQLLKAEGGLFQLRYPLETRQFTSAPIDALHMNIALTNQPGLRTIYSPNVAVTTERLSDSSANIAYQATNYHPQGDFVLYFGTNESAIGVNLLSYQPAGEDGYFALLAAPSLDRAADAVVQRDIVMVVDVSGSMNGEKLQQAKDALHYVVDQLNPDDRFNLIAFSTGVKIWQPQLQSVNGQVRDSAHQWIERLTATGSTDINRALLEALAQLDPGRNVRTDSMINVIDRPAYLLFLTDGLPTQGERNSDRIIGNVFTNQPMERSLRLFTFGVGYDVNTTLLDTLSGELNGRSSYVQPNEHIDEVVGNFYQGISTPVLSDVELAIVSAGEPADSADPSRTIVIDDLYPYPLPDLFAGEQLVVTGRYHLSSSVGGTESVPVEIVLEGKVNGKAVYYDYANQHVLTTGGDAQIARLWASRKIGAMLQQIRRSGPDQELIDAIVELSLQYGIVTPYTSSFVPEPLSQSDRDGVLATTALDSSIGLADDEVDAFAAPVAEGAAAAVTERVQQATGADAVAMSEKIGALQRADVAQSSQNAKFAGGHTFVLQQNLSNDLESPSARWVDTRYSEPMQLETIAFGSHCYFALLTAAREPNAPVELQHLAEWLSVAPDLIVVLNDQHALLITTEADPDQSEQCPTIQGLLE